MAVEWRVPSDKDSNLVEFDALYSRERGLWVRATLLHSRLALPRDLGLERLSWNLRSATAGTGLADWEAGGPLKLAGPTCEGPVSWLTRVSGMECKEYVLGMYFLADRSSG